MRRHANRKFLVCLHGEVEYLFNKRLTMGQRIKAYFMACALRNVSKNTKLVVFSDHVKSSLLDEGFLDDNHIISINHPILQFERVEDCIHKVVTFSHLGVANRRKNSALIFPLADYITGNVATGLVKFSIVGRVDKQTVSEVSANVVVESKDNASIDNEAYMKMIKMADYSLIFMEESEYVYRVSGSLLDSIQYQIPLIALRHKAVNELFEKGGDIGFLCHDFEEMKEVILQVASQNPNYLDRYPNQVRNLKKLSKTYYATFGASIISSSLKTWAL